MTNGALQMSVFLKVQCLYRGTEPFTAQYTSSFLVPHWHLKGIK